MKKCLNFFTLFILTVSLFSCGKDGATQRAEDATYPFDTMAPDTASKMAEQELKEWTFLQKSDTFIPLKLSQKEKEMVIRGNQFAGKLYRELVREEKNGNFVFSPISLEIATAMLAGGGNDQVYREMANALGWGNDCIKEEVAAYYKKVIRTLISSPYDDFSLELANAVWIQKGFLVKEDFLNSMRDNYYASIGHLDFKHDLAGANKAICDWAEEMTHGKIKDLNLPVTPLTDLALNNTTYFKAAWENSFSLESHETKFHNMDGTKCMTRLMKNNFRDPEYVENESYQALNLNYGNGTFCMTVVLPRKGVSLETVERMVDWSLLKPKHDPKISTEVVMEMPLFQTSNNRSIKEALKRCQIVKIWEANQFDGISEKIRLDDVLQNTTINVDENGTEAACAVTYTTISICEPEEEIIRYMKVDRPFYYAIRDKKSGIILFMGRVSQL